MTFDAHAAAEAAAMQDRGFAGRVVHHRPPAAPEPKPQPDETQPDKPEGTPFAKVGTGDSMAVGHGFDAAAVAERAAVRGFAGRVERR